MEDNKMVRLAAGIIIASVAIPVVIGAVSVIGVGATNIVRTAKFKHKIKKGLKDGSIVEIDGEYYEVEVTEEA